MSIVTMRQQMTGSVLGIVVFALMNAQLSAAAEDGRAESAKMENKVVWWTTVPVDQSKVLADQFRKQFPSIEVDLFRTGATSLQNKIVTEARGRKTFMGSSELQRRVCSGACETEADRLLCLSATGNVG
jgi:hypothetical protein